MKNPLQQISSSRRSNSIRMESSPGNLIRSLWIIFWLFLHGFCCLVSLILGIRFSRVAFLFLFSVSSPSDLLFTPSGNVVKHFSVVELNKSVSSRVVAGRHGIRIRPWPYPNPEEVMKAHHILSRVQADQRTRYGIKNPRTVIAVTPTYVRTFQKPHLTGVMHSLMLVRYDVIWIVVEAGGISNETASIFSGSGLKVVHIGYKQKMPTSWEGRHVLEGKMRHYALKVIRRKKLDGIVIFADDSNMHSMDLFDEIQAVKWFGALSIGIVSPSLRTPPSSLPPDATDNMPIPVQGPACNSSDKLVGWHIFNPLPYKGLNAISIDDVAPVLPRRLEWANFVLNSRLLWSGVEDKPDWVRDFDMVGSEIESPLLLLKDSSMIEPLGGCGRQVLIWWLRVEAHTDSKFPKRWLLDPSLKMTVPAKRTPWPRDPPELPSRENNHSKLMDQASPHSKNAIRSHQRKRRPEKPGSTKQIFERYSGKH